MAETLQGPEFQPSNIDQDLFVALMRARRRHGGSTPIVQDDGEEPLSYDKLVRACLALSAPLARRTERGERVGLLLPTGAAALIAFFALQASGRVAVFLNYSADPDTMTASAELARVTRVLTSRTFLRRAQLGDAASKLSARAELVNLEDLRAEISWRDKLWAAARAATPALIGKRPKPNDPALILFTSGTTGTPKGAVLSHRNILANIEQCRAYIPFDPGWVFFDALPAFHSLGLTCGALLPILSGMKTVLHPNPLEYDRIPELIRESGANVLISTKTFAKLYARKADERALGDLRYVVLGGERVDDATRDLYAEKSPAAVIEGYGVTETAPVIAVNHPEDNRPGTVGKLLPGVEARLEEVEDVEEGERLCVRGPNVMIGYLDADADVASREDEWFDTGDLVRIDEDGFIRVTGRVKRYARIGAEMVSLEAVEKHAGEIWPDAGHAAVMFERPEGEEAIALVTDQENAARSYFAEWASAHDVSRLAVPRKIVVVDELPRIGVGTPDYAAVRRMLSEKLEQAAQPRQGKDASGDAASASST